MERSRIVIGQSWFWGVKLALATGITYFLAARVGLILRAEPGLAIFWPAAGVSAGALIALGPRARLPVAVAAFVASTACGLLIGRNAALSIAFGFLNTLQTLVTAWLLERWFGRTFKLEDVRRVLWFFTATAVGSAIAAAGAVVAMSLIKATAPPLQVWGLWFAASSLGVVTVAPLLIGLGDAMRERLPRHELVEGWAGLIALTVLTGFLIALPDGPWATALPEAVVFPFLLWIAIRCRRVFAAGAALLVGLTVIGSTALNVGNFDSGKPLAERILAAQTFVLIESILVVLLAAVFAERRRTEQRLQLALDGATLGAFSADLATGKLACDLRAAQSHGHSVPPTTIKESRRFVHPEDLKRIDGAIAEAEHTSGNWKAEYRVVPPPGHPHADETRWVAVDGSIVRDAHGAPMQLLGITRDITLSKRGEQELAERNTQLELASKAARIGSYAIDFPTGLVNLSPGCANILGLPESTFETSRENTRKLVHSEDLVHFDASLKQAFLKRQREFITQIRITRANDGEVRWIEARGIILHDRDGRPLRFIAVIIDFTERKLAEQVLTERNTQLALAARAALVGSYVYDIDKGTMQVSPGYAAIHGLPEGTTETTICKWRARVHPEDLVRVEGLREQAFADRRMEDNAEYRIILPNGEVRWIERRGAVSYNKDGCPERVVGVNIDVTGRKRAEERQRVLLAELDHRVKNALATVSSVVSQTAVGSTSVANFVNALDGRLRSMATTHELLSSGRWQGISLPKLIRQELAPYATGYNTKISGPEVVLHPEAGQAIAMVLHELATNAAKYGALSSQKGIVSIQWNRQLNGHPPRLVLEWQESGGPPVVASDRASFGMSTIRDLIPYEFGGSVDLAFVSSGVQCRLELPAHWFTDSNDENVSDIAHASLRTGNP